jgi:hypothetical protein
MIIIHLKFFIFLDNLPSQVLHLLLQTLDHLVFLQCWQCVLWESIWLEWCQLVDEALHCSLGVLGLFQINIGFLVFHNHRVSLHIAIEFLYSFECTSYFIVHHWYLRQVRIARFLFIVVISIASINFQQGFLLIFGFRLLFENTAITAFLSHLLHRWAFIYLGILLKRCMFLELVNDYIGDTLPRTIMMDVQWLSRQATTACTTLFMSWMVLEVL